MLTNAAVKAARGRARAYKLGDAGGLYLHVLPSGTRTFRLKFRHGGKEGVLTFGPWPEVSLDQARAQREAARARLGQGEDPRVPAITIPVISTFEQAARAWHAHRRAGWTPVHAADVLASLERDVFPAIGAAELGAVKTPAIVALLRAVERRRAVETARRLQQRIAKIYALACAEGWTEHNPAAGVVEALAHRRAVRRHPALIDAGELRALLAAVDHLAGAGNMIVLASRFLALTAVRLAAVRGARWGEIEDLDGDAPLWRVPAARMKLAAEKKLDAANDHLVPLSAAAVAVLRAARSTFPGAKPSDLIFPGRNGEKFGEGAIGALYARAGFAGRHVPHGWRASFSTILNERRPADRAAIDRALGHAAGGRDEEEQGINRKVEGAYNRAEHLPLRHELFHAWGELLVDPVQQDLRRVDTLAGGIFE